MLFDNYAINGVDRISIPIDASSHIREKALALYTPTRLHARLAWGVIKRLSRMARPRGIVQQTNGPSCRIDGFDSAGWVKEVCAILGRTQLTIAYYFPPERSRSKCAALLFGTDGTPAAFAKIAWGNTELSQAWRESEGLAFYRGREMRSFQAPNVLYSGEYDGRSYALFSPIPSNARAAPSRWTDTYRQCWVEMANSTMLRMSLSQLDWWSDAGLRNSAWKQTIKLVEGHEPDEGYRFYAAHGDFAPWNARVLPRSLYLFDWEGFEPQAPLFLDPFYFALSREVLVRNHRDPTRVASAINKVLHSGPLWPEPADVLLAQVYLKVHLQGDSLVKALDNLVLLSIRDEREAEVR